LDTRGAGESRKAWRPTSCYGARGTEAHALAALIEV
jgi:hypothetical protein